MLCKASKPYARCQILQSVDQTGNQFCAHIGKMTGMNQVLSVCSCVTLPCGSTFVCLFDKTRDYLS